jgi:hypothetical protein
MRPLVPWNLPRHATPGRPARTFADGRPVVRFRLAAILAAQLFDYVTFRLMVELHGIHLELNPIVSRGYDVGGFGILLLAKLALVLLVGATIVILGRRSSPSVAPSRLAAAVTLIAVYGGLVGGVSNTLMIWS